MNYAVVVCTHLVCTTKHITITHSFFKKYCVVECCKKLGGFSKMIFLKILDGSWCGGKILRCWFPTGMVTWCWVSWRFWAFREASGPVLDQWWVPDAVWPSSSLSWRLSPSSWRQLRSPVNKVMGSRRLVTRASNLWGFWTAEPNPMIVCLTWTLRCNFVPHVRRCSDAIEELASWGSGWSTQVIGGSINMGIFVTCLGVDGWIQSDLYGGKVGIYMVLHTGA